MPRKGIASIGVDFGARELRAVEVSSDGRSIKHFASAILPAVGLEMGIPRDPTGLAELLRGLFRDLNPSAKGAVFGLPALAVTSRVLDVPAVPDAELKTILDGEVQHYGIVRGFGGMFDYLKLSRSAADKDSEPQALVMASEAVQLNAIRDGAERAKIDKVAIEPSMLGLIRLAAMHHSSSEACLLIAVTGDIAEIAITVDHKIRLYRRLELADEAAEDAFIRGMSVPAEEVVPAFLRADTGAGVANKLVLELKRTLDYLKREFEASTVKHAVLAVSSPKEAPLAELLADGLELPVDLARAPLPGDDGLRFGAAYGLAAGATHADLGIPLFDLSPYDPVAEQNDRQRRILATSMTASIIIVLGSIVGGLYFGRQANDVAHHLDEDKLALANLQKNALPEAMARQSKLEAYRALSAYGIPVPQVVDSLHSVLDPKTGLSSIDIAGVQVKLEGEAADEASMIKTLERLRTQRGFQNAFIESFDQSPADEQKVVRFRLTANLGSGGALKP